jgi:hypothetical protein
MNAAQRAILKVVLAIEALLILRPPFRFGVGANARDLGHHWFFYGTVHNVDIATLAYEVLIVSVFGALLVALTGRVSDERFAIMSGFRQYHPGTLSGFLRYHLGFVLITLLVSLLVLVYFLTIIGFL